MKILLPLSSRLRLAAVFAASCFIIGDCSAAELDTPEKMLAEFTPIRSQKGIKVVGHVRKDNRSGFECMWHLRHSPKRFAALSAQVGLHRCKKKEIIWQRREAIKEFHLESVSLVHYSELCGREPGDFVLVSPDRSESYYFAVVF